MLTFLFIVLMAPICNAQEEIIFNKQDIDKKDIKVSRTLQGLEFNMDFIRINRNPSKLFSRKPDSQYLDFN